MDKIKESSGDEYTAKKAREEKLDQILRNRLYQGDSDKAFQNNIPYEISFHEEIENHGGTNDNIAVQIIEKGKLSTRKYVIFISDMITIGRSGENALVLNDFKNCKGTVFVPIGVVMLVIGLILLVIGM